tara:strand:- start:1715 stop:2200 length:486 start_codon:yes stop_codon:yes gene_type:complete
MLAMTNANTSETWDEAAERHVFRIWDNSSNLHFEDPVKQIRKHVDRMIDTFFHGDAELESEFWWLNLGGLVLLAYGDLDPYEVSRILADKQRDYGPNNIARFAEKGLILRLHDKVARLENLLSSSSAAKNESIADTYLDIIGYSVIGLMWMNDEFFNPLKS